MASSIVALDSHWNAGSQFAELVRSSRLPQTDAIAKIPPSADDYRKRAAAIGKRLGRKGQRKHGLELLRRKQQALLALADNEDWLVGRVKEKPKPKAKVRRRLRPASSV